MSILTNKGYIVKKSQLSDAELREARKKLTVKPKETPYTCVFVDYSFKVYQENDELFCVPRFWGIQEYGPPAQNKLMQGVSKLDKKNLKLKCKLRDYQVKPLEKVYKHLKNTGGCTLQVECGWGKSLAGIYIAYQLGLKTIVIAPRVKIVTQWMSEIKRFLPRARVGLIQGTVKEIDDVDFCVATLQTIGLKDFSEKDFRSFGIAIFDELPFFAANKMSSVLWKVYSAYNLGLSADPERADGLDKIFEWYLGPSKVKSHKPIKRTHIPLIRQVFPPEKFYDRRIEKTGNINLAGMINDLVASQDRFNVICDQLNSLIEEDSQRRVLVMADRREYLKALYTATKSRWPQKECLLFLGGNSKKKLSQIDDDLKNEKYHVIFATFALIGVGVSIDYLNTAVFATPKKSKMTEQASGRIMRKDHQIVPVIVDIIDDNGIFKNQWRDRRRLYNIKGWKQENVLIKADGSRVEKKSGEEDRNGDQEEIKTIPTTELKQLLNAMDDM